MRKLCLNTKLLRICRTKLNHLKTQINERLLAELNEMKQKTKSDNEEIISTANALERLQTVIDVCEEQNRNKDEELCKRHKEISHLKKEVELLHAEKPIENESELTKLNLRLEEMSITMTSLQQMKDAYEAKITYVCLL